MTEQQAWLLFVCEPALLLMFALLYIGAKRAITPPDDSTGRTPSMPAGHHFKPDSRLKPFNRHPDMLTNNEDDNET